MTFRFRKLDERFHQVQVVFRERVFKSPAGQKYVLSQPAVLDEMVRQMEVWTRDVSEYVMIRVRAEMGKRGHVMQ